MTSVLEIDFCEKISGYELCARRNAICINHDDGYNCSCNTGFVMERFHCQSATVTFSGSFVLPKSFQESHFDKTSSDYKVLESNIIRAISIATHLQPSVIQITEFRPGSIICNYAVMLRSNMTVEEFNKLLYAACQPHNTPELKEDICLLSSKIAIQNRSSLLDSTSYFNACSYSTVNQYCPTDLMVCENLGWGNYDCHCKRGLRLLSQKDKIPLCVDVDECLKDEICPPNMRCKNYFGGYTCDCLGGYIMMEGICQEICKENPCQNEGVCVLHGLHDYRCRCPDSFQGDHCELTSKKYQDLLLTLYIVAGSLGGLVVLTCIGASIWQKRSQKKQLSLMNSTYEADALDSRLKAESTEMLNSTSSITPGWRL